MGLGGIVFGLIESNTRGITDPAVITSLGIGAAALAGFLFVEGRAKNPMMPLELFRSRTFTGANLLTFFLYAALGGLLFFLPFNLIRIQGYAPTAAGAALLPFVLTMFFLSRWAGGLVDRYGSKLPLVVGPIVAAVGFALFALPGAETGSYWTSFFPAVMVMSAGMTISVAPLTTTVMSAIEGRRAGIASGINNAVARTASLLAIAVFGVFMLSSFTRNLAERLRVLPLPSDARAELVARSADFVNLELPDGVSEEMQPAIEGAIREAFVAGFRLVAGIAAGLAVASALAAWVLIEGKAPPAMRAAPSLSRGRPRSLAPGS